MAITTQAKTQPQEGFSTFKDSTRSLENKDTQTTLNDNQRSTVTFMKEWYKKLGYYQNPFLINPMKERTSMIGARQQLEDAMYYLQAGNLVVVEAKKGNGKTKFLRTLIDNFRGKVIYVNARKLDKTLDVEELLRNKNGFSGKIMGKKPKGMMLMIDNAEELSLVNIERLKNYFDQGYLQSIIFTTSDLESCEFSNSMKNRIGRRVITLEKPEYNDMKAIIKERLDEKEDEEEPLINEEHIKKIYETSESVGDMFVRMESAFEKMDTKGDETISAEHYNEKLDKDDNEYIEIELKLSKEKRDLLYKDDGKILKVGSYYRDPTKDMFCSNCGAIVDENDMKCPECNAIFEEGESDEQDRQEEKNETTDDQDASSSKK